MLKITEKLMLESVESNRWKHDERDREITICWQLNFSFCGIDGFSALLIYEGITRPYKSFALVESDDGDLHDSFRDQLEAHWNTIVKSVQEWEQKNFKEQTDFVNKIEQNRIDAGLV